MSDKFTVFLSATSETHDIVVVCVEKAGDSEPVCRFTFKCIRELSLYDFEESILGKANCRNWGDVSYKGEGET